MKHTPAPWNTERNDHHAGNIVTVFHCQNNDCVEIWSENWPDAEAQEANARLIAAAPELLEALKSLCECYCESGNYLSKEDRNRHRITLIKARAAIAKATGAE